MNKIYQKTYPAGKNAGFTLIELLVVVLIIGILAAVALPQYQKAVSKSRTTEAIVTLKSIIDAEEVYYMANGAYTDDLSLLDVQVNPTGKYFKYSCNTGGDDVVRTCAAHPLQDNLPLYIEFHLLNEGPENYRGKKWCVAKTSDSLQVGICKSYGPLDTSMTSSTKSFYLISL